jgi:CDP-2,3-bis-(O-geranylgeranyl)-sn-glycerol synthase
MIERIIKAFWLMIPAYLANPFAAVFGGGKPIDGGRTYKDGRRILGDGKTYRGLFSGIFCGFLAGCIEIWLSFFKRRMGLKRGASLPLVDQLDFVAGAWVFSYLAAPEWFVSNFTRGIMLVVVIITPLLHLTTNVVGYFIGVKKEPW